MPSPELLALWERVETALRSVAADANVADECGASVNEWLDHNELGLAWSTLRRHVIESHDESDGTTVPDSEIVRRLTEVGAWMGLDWEDPEAG
jgi:hypothetical protein